MNFPAQGLERLAEKISKGDVVFFIGTGCSLDSERNSARRLMWRLLLRVVAFAEALGEEGGNVLDDLRHTFTLKGKTGEEIACGGENVDVLARRYYEANDWFCDAFGHLLEILAEHTDRDDRDQILSRTQKRAEELRAGLPEKERDPVSFDAIASSLAEHVGDYTQRRAAGKTLFLDTMGFRNASVMGGRPNKQINLRDLDASYSRRLFPRHHVLARLAREGLCTTLITTNFDMLIEGAYLLAGFSNPPNHQFPATLVSDFEVIASPDDFFTKGKAYRTAVVLKMHGDAQRYRSIMHSERDELRDYLRSMVFTYREIQNWREDSWAADYLRTLLRTRVVVFCGYSLQDPVIHDTFRTVYEEMRHAKRINRPALQVGWEAAAKASSSDAPAFFFAPDANAAREFHGMAVLGAASEAIGARQTLFGEHPNYLRFHFRDGGKFPNLDELMSWLFHLTLRARQAECLANDLRRITTLLVDRPRPETELTAVRSAFSDLRKDEQNDAKSWDTGAASRRQHARHCGWTNLFHVGLLREFACADLVRQRQGAGFEVGLMRRFAWYYPAMQDASWTCWGAVVELALRNMARAARATLYVGDCQRPTVLARSGDHWQTPHALTIQFEGFERVGLSARLHGHPLRRFFWQLGRADAPWPRAKSRAEDPSDLYAKPCPCAMRRAPCARDIWDWASQSVAKVGASDKAKKLLGLLPI